MKKLIVEIPDVDVSKVKARSVLGAIIIKAVQNGKVIEPCDDVISREAIIERLDDFNKWCKDGRLQGSLFAVDVIKDMPSVQPSITTEIEKSNFSMEQYKADIDTAYQCGYEQGKKDSNRKGHWIRHDNGKYHWYLCSCCDAMAGSDEKMMAYNFCPNCGADMRGE